MTGCVSVSRLRLALSLPKRPTFFSTPSGPTFVCSTASSLIRMCLMLAVVAFLVALDGGLALLSFESLPSIRGISISSSSSFGPRRGLPVDMAGSRRVVYAGNAEETASNPVSAVSAL
eukprot:CAMPEP_0119534288 /NCGR_PEP_ID=MMETSP1344-20130328/47549_1 /TAXON_ID=236787 /ORGANISM="Florenciella parvula, Strain CCMP2471" /LENGTH=117 /DNA_ID=CAMNT_0007575501 /DNA_START=23 /DNA_END=376 /DNA_ORIENTATION=-